MYELPLTRDESPALAFSRTLLHITGEASRRTASTPATSKPAVNVSLVVVVFGHNVVAAQDVYCRFQQTVQD